MSPLAQTYPQLALQLAQQPWAPADFALVRRAYDLAAVLFAGQVRGSGKPFVDHLVGTASGVLLDGAGADVVAAALLHAAYDQGDFGDRRPALSPGHRAVVRAKVGTTVEAIVFEYEQMGWGTTVAERLRGNLSALGPVPLAALRVRLANELDDALDGGLVLSGKLGHPDARQVPERLLLEFAECVCGPAFVTVARRVLARATPEVPPELVIGAVGSLLRLPLSARRRGDRRDRVRAALAAGRRGFTARFVRRFGPR